MIPRRRDTLIILIVIVFIAALTLAMHVQTVYENQAEDYESQLWQLQREKDLLLAEKYWLSMRRRVQFIHPLGSTWISSGLGYRKDPMGGVGEERLHKGIDLVDVPGTDILAAMDGLVMEHWLVPGWHNGVWYNGHGIFGGFIVIQHSEELYSLYGHLGQTQVHEGQYVRAGEKIGELGSTGLSTGPHLHFEIVVDPFVYLEGKL